MWFVGTFVIWLGVPLVTGLVDQSMFLTSRNKLSSIPSRLWKGRRCDFVSYTDLSPILLQLETGAVYVSLAELCRLFCCTSSAGGNAKDSGGSTVAWHRPDVRLVLPTPSVSSRLTDSLLPRPCYVLHPLTHRQPFAFLLHLAHTRFILFCLQGDSLLNGISVKADPGPFKWILNIYRSAIKHCHQWEQDSRGNVIQVNFLEELRSVNGLGTTRS